MVNHLNSFGYLAEDIATMEDPALAESLGGLEIGDQRREAAFVDPAPQDAPQVRLDDGLKRVAINEVPQMRLPEPRAVRAEALRALGYLD